MFGLVCFILISLMFQYIFVFLGVIYVSPEGYRIVSTRKELILSLIPFYWVVPIFYLFFIFSKLLFGKFKEVWDNKGKGDKNAL